MMVLGEPKVEFVPIDLSQSIVAASNKCPIGTTTGGISYCFGTEEPTNASCPDGINDIDWDDMDDWD